MVSGPKYNKRGYFMHTIDLPHEGELYTLRHVALITGLTERTIRSYISKGFLSGEKINGIWHFELSEMERFLKHPAVRPAIVAKNNSIIYDSLLGVTPSEPHGCMVLDLPGENGERVSEHFCRAITEGEEKGIRFAFDGNGGVPRIMLSGPVPHILKLASEYFK